VCLPGKNVKFHALLEPFERRTLLDATIVQDEPATLFDADGSQITIALDGPGTAWADASRGRLSLSLSGGSTETKLSITVSGGDGRALSRLVRISGAVGTIDAPKLELRGVFSARFIDSATFLAISYADVQTGWIGSLTTRRIDHSKIHSDRLGQIIVSGNVDASRIFVSPANDKPVALESVKVKGALIGSSIFALGDIGTVTAAAMIDSNVTAGVRIDERSTDKKLAQPLPDDDVNDFYDFTGKYRIFQVVVSGKTDRPVAFSNSIIGAYEIRDVSLSKVNGAALGRPEFGVAGYLVGSVKRTFDAPNRKKDAQETPATDFTVRQIKEELIFNPGLGGYTGSSGSVSVIGGSGTINGNPWFNTGPHPILVGNVQGILTQGALLGSVTNHAASSVYLAHGGNFELRTGTGEVVLAAATLGALGAALFRASHTSIKLERIGTEITTLRATSIGPVVSLDNSALGIESFAAFDANGQPTNSLNYASRQPRSIPSVEVLTSQLASEAEVKVFTNRLLLVKDQPLPLGKVVSALGQHDVGLTQSLQFSAGGQLSTELGLAVAGASADRVGSRRFPARWVPNGTDSIIVYGLRDGGTAVITKANLARSALNATGEVLTMPDSDALKQSLWSRGIDFE
jgi:hypothetical protein